MFLFPASLFLIGIAAVSTMVPLVLLALAIVLINQHLDAGVGILTVFGLCIVGGALGNLLMRVMDARIHAYLAKHHHHNLHRHRKLPARVHRFQDRVEHGLNHDHPFVTFGAAIVASFSPIPDSVVTEMMRDKMDLLPYCLAMGLGKVVMYAPYVGGVGLVRVLVG